MCVDKKAHWLDNQNYLIRRETNPTTTLPELRLYVCLLWNKADCLALNTDDHHTQLVQFVTLRHINNIHIGLHQGDDAVPVPFSASESDWKFRSPYRLGKVHDHDNIQSD